MPTILALDQGTTGSTALVFGPDGAVRGRGYREIPQHFPHPGHVEHEPEDLFTSIVASAREALAQHGGPVDAIGITNQRETLVLWERDSLQPLGRAIVWQDRRTAARCAELREAGHEPWLREQTGLLLDPYFSATKLEARLADPAVRAAAEAGRLCAGTVESWLVARLTGGQHVSDATNASRTLLAAIASGEWHPELLDFFGVPPAMMAEIVPSAGQVGTALPKWFGTALPITGLVGDQQGALFGQGCTEPGSAKITYGTGAFLLRFTGTESPPVPREGILATIAANADGGMGWALEGSVFVAGAAVQWLRDGLGIIDSAEETAALAASVPDTGGVTLVPAFTGLGAPYWNPEARGTLVGLTRGTSRAHLVRATLEAIAHGTCDLAEAMGGVTTLRVDGGAANNDWLMQAQADLLGVPVERPVGVELTAYGAARLAAVGIGGALPPAPALGAITVFEPQRSADWRAEQRGEWQRAVTAALVWAAGSGET
jgi:glycerol kinase